MQQDNIQKFSAIGMLITIGIVFGDIGTSPLYVMKAITSASEGHINSHYMLGALSCIFWTLTSQTTFKYVWIALRADNKGEGGILALYSLIKRTKNKWFYIVAIIGAAALVSDGIITPPMTIISAIEGLKIYNHNIDVVKITIVILVILFSVQQFGTGVIGKFFGPLMTLWFLMLAIIGVVNIIPDVSIFRAINPYYAIDFLRHNPNTLLIMGAVFLCVTGAEALYSDMGHCGKKNIRISWIYIKICLVLNYLGQGVWVLSHKKIAAIAGVNPFFMMMPEFFLIPGIIMATLAAIIASQSLITGSYTIFSEAMTLNFWPHQRIEYPALNKGQMYIPIINWIMLALCIFVVIHFKSSAAIESAYGFAITITMLMTTILLIFYLYYKRTNIALILIFSIVYLTIEGGFFYANALKFAEGGYIAIFLALIIGISMYCWRNGQRLKNKYVKYVKIAPYLSILNDVKNDKTIPKFATNLIYISKALRKDEIDAKIIYSIVNKHPKRADHYWFVAIQYNNEPYTFDYEILNLIPDTATKIKFNLGYKMPPLVSIYFNQVLENLTNSGDFNMLSNYPSLQKHNINADFQYIVIDRVFTPIYTLSVKERLVLRLYNFVKLIGIDDITAWGLNTYNVIKELVPITTDIVYDSNNKIKEKKH